MRPGAVKVETNGSYWWLDDQAREYLRLPKHEGPRERPEWGNAQAGALQDAVWHPMDDWTLSDTHLLIFHDGTRAVVAPRWAVSDA